LTVTNVGFAYGTAPGVTGGGPLVCSPTYGSLAQLPSSPLGPPCVWSLWVDGTLFAAAPGLARTAVCGADPLNPGLNTFGISGTLTFNAATAAQFPPNGSFPFAPLVVPVTLCDTDTPVLTLGMPNTFPNPTFGPTTGTGFGNCNSGGAACLLAQPSNLIPGFPLSIVDMVLAQSTGTSAVTATAAPITLLAAAGNSSQVCKILDIRTTGSTVAGVTIAPILPIQWLTVQPLGNVTGGAVFLGPPVNAPNSLQANSIPAGSFPAFPTIAGIPNVGIFGLGSLIGNVGIPGTPPFAAGPFTVVPAMQTFAICANTDPLGNTAGFNTATVTINGAGVGSINIPINFQIGNAPGAGTPGTSFSQLGVYRPTSATANTSMAFYLDADGNNAWNSPPDKVKLFGVTGIPGTTVNDVPVAGDWDGTGVVRFGVFHCPVAALGPCTWFIDLNNNGTWDGTFGGDAVWPNFGLQGDVPAVGDWTGDGKSKIGVMRCPAGAPTCVFYLDLGNKHTYDPATVGIYFIGTQAAGTTIQPAVGKWTAGSAGEQIGVAQCVGGGACTWTGDTTGKTGTGSGGAAVDVRPTATTVATFTPPGGFTAGFTPGATAGGDVAVMGNWNGNGTPLGTKRVGIFRSSTGQWFVDTNGNGTYDAGVDQIFSFGLPPAANPGGVGDYPIVGFWTMP